jgi:carbamoyl-phosphate synthase large subunit
MVNCNPETVSTDYDTSDRLYFEPLTAEDVIELARVEQRKGTLLGCIVQFGGRRRSNWRRLWRRRRSRSSAPRRTRSISPRTANGSRSCCTISNCASRRTASRAPAKRPSASPAEVGYPVVIRPSYVLGGRAMEIVHEPDQLRRYIRRAVQVSGDNPVLIDSYLEDAIEVDVDALCDGKDVFVAGIMEHIEEAGDPFRRQRLRLPPHTLRSR